MNVKKPTYFLRSEKVIIDHLSKTYHQTFLISEKQKKLSIKNMFVVDGTIEALPFPDKSFDIVMSGHVFGDDYDKEYLEVECVTKTGGYIIDCPGEDDRKQPYGAKPEMIRLGFDYSHYASKTGGEVYRYWKKITHRDAGFRSEV